MEMKMETISVRRIAAGTVTVAARQRYCIRSCDCQGRVFSRPAWCRDQSVNLVWSAHLCSVASGNQASLGWHAQRGEQCAALVGTAEFGIKRCSRGRDRLVLLPPPSPALLLCVN